MTVCNTVLSCKNIIEDKNDRIKELVKDKADLKDRVEELKTKKEELQAKVEKCREPSGPSTPRNNGPSAAAPANASTNASANSSANTSSNVSANASANTSGPAPPSLNSLVGGRRSRKARGRKTARRGGGCGPFGCFGTRRHKNDKPPSNGHGFSENKHRREGNNRRLADATHEQLKAALAEVRRNHGHVANRTRSKH